MLHNNPFQSTKSQSSTTKPAINEVITEMCDVCCKDIDALQTIRTKYVSPRGIMYVIRHHKGCDPQLLIKAGFCP